MRDMEDLKSELASLDARDKRWMITCAVVGVAALLFALLIGNVIGDIVGFVLAVGVGWVIRSQWEIVTHAPRRQGSTSQGRNASSVSNDASTTESSRSRWRRRASASLDWMINPGTSTSSPPEDDSDRGMPDPAA